MVVVRSPGVGKQWHDWDAQKTLRQMMLVKWMDTLHPGVDIKSPWQVADALTIERMRAIQPAHKRPARIRAQRLEQNEKSAQ